MDYKQLVFFLKTAELEHMTKAATELQVSQPFLSRTIGELEQELGVKLFERVGRGIKLNEYGASFQQKVAYVFNELESAQKELQIMASNKQIPISIITNVGLYLPGLLKNMAITHPKVRTKIFSSRKRKIISSLKSGTVDFAVVATGVDNEPDIMTVPLIKDKAVLIHPKDHWLKDCTEVELERVVSEPMISVAKGFGTRDVIDQECVKANLEPNIIIETGDTSSIPEYVNNGLGIAFMPLSVLRRKHIYENQNVRISNYPMVGISYLAWNKRRFLSEIDKEFIEMAKRFFFELEKTTL